jgi:putative transposase
MVSPEIKRIWIETDHPNLSIVQQCSLSGLARSSFYHEPSGVESDENLRLMRQIDELYLKRPFYGSPRMTDWLGEWGWRVNEKRVARLMRVMGIQAILPGPHTSRPHPAHRVYPYLLRGLEIRAANEVWCADITYVPLRRGFMYLIAIMDWFSRYVLAWALSNTQDVGCCVTALQQALKRHGPPEIFNTDQGAQFTSEEFTSALQRSDIRISMDGRGRALDNVFIERLWRSVKYEDVYPRDYLDGHMMSQGLGRYFRFYNTQRRHQSLEKRTPAEVYFGNN